MFYPGTLCVIISICNYKTKSRTLPDQSSNPAFITKHMANAMYIPMITIKTDFCNPISQELYNKIIFSLELSQVSCTCGHSGCLIWYGRYCRKVRLEDQVICLHVSRVFCSVCGHSHAILLSSIVPYSQIPMQVQAAVADCYETKRGYHSILSRQYFIDENTISSIIRSYRLHWRERLRSHTIPLLPPDGLIRSCFAFFSRPFMQIKSTRNKLFVLPT